MVMTGREAPAAEPGLPPSRQGSVVLDIGGDVGAAIVYLPAGLTGREIEIRRAGAAWDGVHTAVRERRLGSITRFAAVFGALPAGSYQLRVRHGGADPVVLQVEVDGGAITESAWPDRPGPVGWPRCGGSPG
jgi:hypothetical protein